MRTIGANSQMSVDGVVESPEQWAVHHFNEEMLEVAQAGMQSSDTILLGRRTYEEFAAFWPSQDPGANPFAGFLQQTRKLVVSNTLTSLDWQPAELISGNVENAIAELKQKPGGNVIILGSATLVGSLLRARLLDTLELFVIPALIGAGKRLFESPEQVPLKLVDSKTFRNGVLSLTYEPAAE